MYSADGALLPGVFAFRTLDDTRAMIEYAQHDRPPPGGRDRRRPARSGGRPRAADARPRGRRGARRQHLMNAQLGRGRRRDPAAQHGRARHRRVHRQPDHRGAGVRTRVTGVKLARPDRDRLRHGRVAAGIRPNTDLAADQRLHRRARDRGRRPDAHARRRRTSTPSASACSTAARSTAWSRRCGSRPWCWPTTITGADPHAAYHGSRTATKLKVAGVEVASMGVTEPERDDDEHIVFSEPSKGVYKNLIIRDGKLVGATLLGDSSKVAFLQQAFDRGLPLPEERVELLFDLGGPAEEVGVAEMADDAQVCNCNGVSKETHRATPSRPAARPSPAVMDATRAGKGCGSCKGLVAPDRRVGGRRGGRGGPVGPLLRAGHPDGQAGADGRDPRARPALGRPRCSPRWPRTAPRTRSPRWGWRRC